MATDNIDGERHEVVVLALDGVIPADLGMPIEVFGRTRLADGREPYRVRVASTRPSVEASHFQIRAPYGLDALASAQTVVVPGCVDPLRPAPPAALDALREAAAGGARVVSICVGAFVLAEAGLLDGRRATTHWAAADLLARRHPAIAVDPTVLFIETEPVFTSAGAAAGIDLCLHLVRLDLGRRVAADTARATVVSLERSGGQAQFITRPPAPEGGGGTAQTVAWLEEHLHEDLSLDQIAAQANVSIRTLNRQFRAHLGASPMRWLRELRIRRAQFLLEETDQPVDAIATMVGFGSPATFRTHFGSIVGTTPSAYRRASGARAQAAAGDSIGH